MSVNILITFELCILSEWILWYVNYIAGKKERAQKMQMKK